MPLRARTNGAKGATDKDYTDLLAAAIQLADSMISDDINRPFEHITDLQSRAKWIAARSFITYGTKLARAVARLVPEDVGLGQQALIIARVLWESAVNLQYMLSQPDLALRWLYFGPVQQRRLLREKAAKYPNAGWARDALSRDIEQVQEGIGTSIQDLYDQAIKQFPDIDWDAKGMMSDWAGRVKIRRKAESIGLLEDYELLYDVLSQRAHSSSAGLADMFTASADRVVPNRDDRPNVVVAVGNATESLLHILQLYRETWGLVGTSAELNAVQRRLDELCPYYPESGPIDSGTPPGPET